MSSITRTDNTNTNTKNRTTMIALVALMLIIEQICLIDGFTIISSNSKSVIRHDEYHFQHGITRATPEMSMPVRMTNTNTNTEKQKQREVEEVEESREKLTKKEKEKEPMKTLSGGPSLIFSMAQRMLIWDDELYNDASSSNNNNINNNNINNVDDRRNGKNDPSSSNGNVSSTPRTNPNGSSSSSSSSSLAKSPLAQTLPRWHPHDGIADANPSFRSQAPAMNNRGYAATIRRNSRKRGKISLWRHALRTYDKMKTIEQEQQQRERERDRERLLGNDTTNNNNNAAKEKKSGLKIRRSTPHFEAALVACAKLGLWREALGIYNEIVSGGTKTMTDGAVAPNGSIAASSNASSSSSKSYGRSTGNNRRKGERVKITDNMILSLISACARGSRSRRKEEYSLEERRLPLDAVRDIVVNLEVKHDIPLVSRHINPLAAAYQNLGLTKESSALVNSCLADRVTAVPNDEEDGIEPSSTFNINDMQAKDHASYNILVRDAIVEGNWTMAIDSLRDMTEAGMYPDGRNLNGWYETARKREAGGGGRKLRSWKKKRERMLVRNTLPMSKNVLK